MAKRYRPVSTAAKTNTETADPSVAVLQHLRAKQLAKLLSIHPITVWHWARKGRLPKPIRLGPHTTVWRATDIAAWLEKMAESSTEAGR